MFLYAIKEVTIPDSPPKGGTFVFEVKFKGGSWIINAPSEVRLLFNTNNEFIALYNS